MFPDILSVEKGAVWMRGLGVDKNLARVEDKPHLFAPRGFLDDSWWHRTYWEHHNLHEKEQNLLIAITIIFETWT